VRRAQRARDQFQAAADGAFRYQKDLDGLAGLTESDRITVSKIKQLQASIHVNYSIGTPCSTWAGRARHCAIGRARGPVVT